jgi:hypothetical protein
MAFQPVTSLFVNNELTVSQDANIYGSYANVQNIYDYTFVLNVSSFSAGITGIFSHATYTQNSANIEDFIVDLQLNTSVASTLNNQDIVTVLIGQSNKAFATLKPNLSESIGDRLLEVVAHKIFGHGQARAAILNDPEYYQHDGEIWSHLGSSVNTLSLRKDIFEQYVASGRYNTWAPEASNSNNPGNNYNDVDQTVLFNFDGLTFDFPMRVVGSLQYDPDLTQAEKDLLSNGPNVGGTLLNSGDYNIPVLVRITA